MEEFEKIASCSYWNPNEKLFNTINPNMIVKDQIRIKCSEESIKNSLDDRLDQSEQDKLLQKGFRDVGSIRPN
jgi:lipid A disaccharide synthetase